MAVRGSGNPTLADWAARVDDDGIAVIIEVMSETNEILADAVVLESNSETGHKTTMRSGLPSVAWRMLNYGVPNSKSRTVQVTDTMGMLEGYSDVDVSLANLNGDVAAFRMSEDEAFLESMSQEMASTTIYGNTDTDPKKFLGLTPRYNDSTAHNAKNLLNGGGTGSDNTSIWLLAWGDKTIHMIFPKGQKAGLQKTDKDQQTVQDENGNSFEAYRMHYKWDLGLTLRDWRYVVRICNLDVSALVADDGVVSSGANLIKLMIKAIHKLPSKRGKRVFYVNETVYTYLDLQTLSQTNMNVSYKELPHGEEVMTFRGIPVRMVDAILDTEAKVTFS